MCKNLKYSNKLVVLSVYICLKDGDVTYDNGNTMILTSGTDVEVFIIKFNLLFGIVMRTMPVCNLQNCLLKSMIFVVIDIRRVYLLISWLRKFKN